MVRKIFFKWLEKWNPYFISVRRGVQENSDANQAEIWKLVIVITKSMKEKIVVRLAVKSNRQQLNRIKLINEFISF